MTRISSGPIVKLNKKGQVSLGKCKLVTMAQLRPTHCLILNHILSHSPINNPFPIQIPNPIPNPLTHNLPLTHTSPHTQLPPPYPPYQNV